MRVRLRRHAAARARARRTARRPARPRRRPRAARPGRRMRTRRRRERSPRSAGAEPELAVDAVGVERPHRHAGLHHRDRQRVVEQRARREAAGLQPLERERLDRRAVLVGVEPDVAEEDAVGVRHRLLAQRHRLRRRGSGPSSSRSRSRSSGGLRPGARRSVSGPAAAAPGTRRRRSGAIQPAATSPVTASASRRAWASARLLEQRERRCSTTFPPRAREVIVGQTATA